MSPHVLVYTFAVGSTVGLCGALAPAQVTSVETQQLVASNGQTEDGLGVSVTMDGDWAIFGAPGSDSLAVDVGAVYAYNLDTGQEFEIPPLAASLVEFGRSLDLDNDVLVVGAPEYINKGMISVYQFNQTYGTWGFSTTWEAQGVGGLGDRLGQSVAVSGDVVAAGGPYNDLAANDGGFVQVRRLILGSGYVIQGNLTASDAMANAWFGWDVAAAGNVVVVGAPGHNGHGAAYIYRYTGKYWKEEAQLVPGLAVVGNRIGYSVATDGNLVLVGVPGHALWKGVVFAYEWNEKLGVWALVDRLEAHDGAILDSTLR